MKRSALPLTIILSALMAVVRIWNLHTGLDDSGLPVSCPSQTVLIALTIVCLVLLIPVARREAPAERRYRVLSPGGGGFSLAIAGCVLVLLGGAYRFAEALVAGATILDPILCLLSIFGGFAGIIVAVLRRKKSHFPFFELLPMMLQIVALILCFKSWSIDPIILDYVFSLLAMIFVLLGIYAGASFVFEQGFPRRALYMSAEAVIFSATAAAGAAVTGERGEMFIYLGFCLWFLSQTAALAHRQETEEIPSEV